MNILRINEIWLPLFVLTIGLGAYIIGTLAPYISKGRQRILIPFLCLISTITLWNAFYMLAIFFSDITNKYIAVLLSLLTLPLMVYFWIEFSITYSLVGTPSPLVRFFKRLTQVYMWTYMFFIFLDPWYHTIFIKMNYTTFEHKTTLLYDAFDATTYFIGGMGAFFIIDGLLRKKVRPPQARLLLTSFALIFIGSFLASKRVFGPIDISPVVSIIVLFALSLWMHKIDIFPFTMKAQEHLFNSVEEAIILLDDDTQPIFYNENALLYFPEIKEGEKLRNIVFKPKIRELRDYFERKEKTKFKKEFKLGGFTHYIEISPIYYKTYLIGYVVVIYDITREAYLREQLEELNKTLEDRVKEREEEIRKMYAKREEELYEMIRSLVDLIDLRDESTGGHSRRIVYYSQKIAEALGLSDEEIRKITFAASLHDIGKIGIPDTILKKPQKLTNEEYKIIKSHAKIGKELLKKTSVFSYFADIVGEHHERWDGKGYPEGKRDGEISIGGQILSVADAFEAMTADRVYRKAMNIDRALEILKEGRGTQFSPKVVDVFVDLVQSGKIEAPFKIKKSVCVRMLKREI